MDRQITDTQNNGQADGRTDGWTDRLMDRQETNIQRERQTSTRFKKSKKITK